MRRLHRQELPPYLYHGTSGWRSNCELAIQVTPRAASSSGCTFYYSDNAVYLTEGVRGAIAPQFISAVVVLQSGEVITSPRAGTAPTVQRDSAEHVKRVVSTCVQRLLLCSAIGHCLFLFLIGAPRLRLQPSCGTLSFLSRRGCPHSIRSGAQSWAIYLVAEFPEH